jgi:Flp pilus assembly protein TadG
MKFTSLLKRFAYSRSGTIAVTYALSIVPVILAMGAAVDYVRYVDSLTTLQAALDSATLSAAVGKGTNAQRIKTAQNTLKINLGTSELAKLGVSSSFEIKDNMVLASADAKMPTAFMNLGGIKFMDVVTKSEVSAPVTKKAEIALVLDYSGSMEDSIGGGVKYIGMRDAAKQLIDDLQSAGPDKVKIGLVPFSHHVYTTLPKEYVLGQVGGGSWSGCTQDRPYPYNISDATPSGANATKWAQPQAAVHAKWGCDGYVSHNLRVTPLTTDFDGLKSQLDSMTPYAWTHIALGVEFGFHVLSENAPFTGGVSYSDKGTQKVMVVLTDGMQTEPAFGPGGIRSVSQGEKNLEDLCATAKANGIKMMTIAYDLDDTTTRARLKGCASDPTKDFFVANDTSGVAAAFDEIRKVVTAQIFFSK